MPDVRLRVNGRDYGGWKTIRVTRGIECIAGSFDLTVSDRWLEAELAWPIREEDECSVLLDGEVVLTGYVDRRTHQLSADDRSLSVAGRDRTGDLVDCSAVLGQWEWIDADLLVLAKKLCEPFGIPVRVAAGVPLKKVTRLTVDPGDSAFDALERACRIAGVLPVSDGRGGLVLSRPGSARATSGIVEGRNLKAGTVEYDAASRFRRYIVMGQQPGTDEGAGELAAAVRGEAFDQGVRRAARVLLVRPEGNVTQEFADTRAQWEATVRAARGSAINVTVQGWRQGSGALWPLGVRVPVESKTLGLDGDLVIAQATYALDQSGGTTTELVLRRPDAFLPEPVVPDDGAWREIGGAG